MKNVKLMAKLIGGFSIVALITLIIGFVGWRSVNNLDKDLTEISEVRLPSIKYLLVMSWTMEEMTKIKRTLLNPNLNMTARKQQVKDFAETGKRFRTAWDGYALLPQTREEARLWKEFVAVWQEVEKGSETFFKLCAELDQTDILNPMALKAQIEAFRVSHYQLIEKTLLMILTGKTFTGEDEATRCPAISGKWLAAFKTSNPVLQTSLREISAITHDEFT